MLNIIEPFHPFAHGIIEAAAHARRSCEKKNGRECILSFVLEIMDENRWDVIMQFYFEKEKG